MNLALVQKALAVLLTDARQRERWKRSPEAFAGDHGLSEEERKYLQELSQSQLEQFASSLVNKRLNAVKKLLPQGAGALEERFSSLFRKFAESYTPSGIWKHGKDAIAFADWVQDKELAPSTAELFRFEGLRLAVARGGLKLYKCKVTLAPYKLNAGDTVLCWRWKQGLRALRLWPLRSLPSQQAPDQLTSEGIH